MSTLLALAFTGYALGPIVGLMVWWHLDLTSRYHRLRRPPIVVPLALQLHHHGRLGAALVDWSAWG